MANDKSFKIKNGLSVGTRYESKAGADGAGADGPSDAFSTDLWTGNATSQTITNNIDLSTDGGLVWIKSRNNAGNNALVDTERGVNQKLAANQTNASAGQSTVTAFNTDGFNIGSSADVNENAYTYVGWTFKEESNFFDVVVYNSSSGNTTNFGSAGATVDHNLGSVPGMIIVKCTDTAATNWKVYHRGLNGGTNPEQYEIELNQTGAEANSANSWNDTAPTSTQFTLGASGDVNNSSRSYVAYLFAHDTSADSYIQCGSYTTDSNEEATITLGWKPQWLLVKRSDSSTGGDWRIIDSVRGVTAAGDAAYLEPNTTDTEAQTGNGRYTFTDTGFTQDNFGANRPYIYVAIRGIAYNYDIDLSTGTYFSMTPSGDTTFTISNPPASGKAIGFALEVNGDGSTLTWPSSIKWHEGTTPTATATKELYTFITTDGGTTYYGKKAGENLA